MRIIKLGVFTFLLLFQCILLGMPNDSPDNVILTGFIYERITTQPLAAVNVVVIGTEIGTTTDQSGYFRLQFPQQYHSVSFQMIGYTPQTLTLQTDSDTTIFRNIFLTRQPLQLVPVNVLGNKPSTSSLFSTTIEMGDLRQRLSGPEADPLRTMPYLTSVGYTTDFSSVLIVRGSAPGQSLITFAGVPVLNPYHMGNLFSVFNPDGIQSLNFTPGITRLEDGNALGGQLNVQPRFALPDAHVKLSLGLLSASGSIGYQFHKVKWFLSGRAAGFDLVSHFILQSVTPLTFYDLQMGMEYTPNTRHTIQWVSYYSVDQSPESESSVGISHMPVFHWGNILSTLSWRAQWSPTFSSTSRLYFSQGFWRGNSSKTYASNQMRLLGGKSILKWQRSAREWIFGGEIRQAGFDYHWKFLPESPLYDLFRYPTRIFYDFAPPQYQFNQEDRYLTLFAGVQQHLFQHSTLLVGTRILYAPHLQNLLLSPRVVGKIPLSEKNTVLLQYAHHIQTRFLLHTQGIRQGEYRQFSVYFPPTSAKMVPRSDYLSLGLKSQISSGVSFRIEGYSKWMSHIPRLTRIQRNVGHPTLQRMHAWGIDNALEYETPFGVEGALSYAFERSQVIEHSTRYPAWFDRKHHLKVSAGYHWKQRWHITLYGLWYSGLPYTPIVGQYFGAGRAVLSEGRWLVGNISSKKWGVMEGSPYSKRIPAYRRIDLMLARSWNFSKSKLSVVFQIYNLLNFANILNYEWTFTNAEHGLRIPVRDESRNFSILPDLQISYQF